MNTITPNDAPVRRKLTRSQSELVSKLFSYLLLCLGSIVILIPFAWMLSTSLKLKADVYIFPPQWIPQPMQWHNYVEAFTTFPFGLYTQNSVIIVVFVMIGTLLSCSFAAYGFSRLNAPGRNFIFLVLLATMMLPSAVTMVPIYLFFNKLGWVDTFLPLIIPAWFGSAFFIFMMRQFFMGIPFELEDSARIDGCNTYGIWARIMVPLSKPVLVTVGVFTFMGTWNDFMGPLIYLTDENKRTLALGLSYFQGSARSAPDLHLLMAASLYAIAPCVILYFLCQKIFVKGMVFTGVKG
ncbi:carbohydrate ABC transporter permease [Paenibacillus lignilyticus]|uniref:Carbohydrate ABC transporter permease n=1 Tax=Paenibacillus lignilyticus TaxID=1172615 RepID=A0ABS5CBD7_9BACL|nr:carbohydrate ABC transporter permease [Paenibacillus lignilyticus]MBP3962428.1 carbohydrate ABC transporter permease [Paenibacillus lignilyticus]